MVGSMYVGSWANDLDINSCYWIKCWFLLAGEVIVDVRQRKVTMSKIFDWYKQDFGSKQVRLPKQKELQYLKVWYQYINKGPCSAT